MIEFVSAIPDIDNYPLRIRLSSSSTSHSQDYNPSSRPCTSTSEDQPDFRYDPFAQGMPAGFSEVGREVEIEEDGNWSSFSSQLPWTVGDGILSQQSLSQQQQQQELQHVQQLSPSQQIIRQSQPDYSSLYATLNPQSNLLQVAPNPRRYTIQNTRAPTSQVGLSHRYIYSGSGSLGNSSGYTYSTSLSAATPSQQASPITASSEDCFCSVMGQPCSCPRPRPHFANVEQTNTGTASSSMSGRETPNATLSDSSPFSPLPLQHPGNRKKASAQHLSLEPASLTASWLDRERGSLVTAYNDEGVTPTSARPSTPIQTPRSQALEIPQSQPRQQQLQHPYAMPQQQPIRTNSLLFAPNTVLQQQQSPQSSSSYSSFPLFDLVPSASTAAAAQYARSQQLVASSSYDAGIGMPTLRTASPELTSMQRSSMGRLSRGLPRPDSSCGGSASQWNSRPSTSGSTYSMDATQFSMSPSSHTLSDSMVMRSDASSSSVFGYGTGHSRSYTTPSATSSTFSKFTAEESDTGSSLSLINPRFSSEEQRWDAIVQRSHSADGHFVYGALTTRIYCRPSCASKRPDRNRVIFFNFPNAPSKAEYAGFRACKRCKPGTPGTADVCVLAVGQCLRHITQAALLGESDEIDPRFKKRTLKEYSLDYGVSAFHFHRTLKNVCTLTPGDYSKACHALVLQDEIGMDKKNGQALGSEELKLKLRGWSSRRARRAVGNILPSTYSHGFPGIKMYCIEVSDTSFGNVAVLYSKGEDANSKEMVAHPLDTDAYSNAHLTVFATLIGDDALARCQKRAPGAVRMPEQGIWLRGLVEDLAKKGLREVQMPPEVIPWVRRARVWLAVKNAMEPKPRSNGKKRSNHSDGDDEEEEEDDGDEDEDD